MTILLSVAAVLTLPLEAMAISNVMLDRDDRTPLVVAMLVFAFLVFGLLFGWRRKETTARGYVTGTLLVIASLVLFSDRVLRFGVIPITVVSGYCFSRLFALRRNGDAFVAMRRLRELRVGQAVLKSAQVSRSPDEPRILRR
ncbi:MAG: hypothetical protein ACJ790_19095 [Myxococcaceae bacterium]